MPYAFNSEGVLYGGGVATATTIVLSGPITVAAGDTIFAMFDWGSPVVESLTSVTDNLGNAYTKIGPTLRPAAGTVTENWVARNATAGACVITGNLPVTRDSRGLMAMSISGLSSVAAITTSANLVPNTSTATDACVGTSVTPLAQPALVLSVAWSVGTSSVVGTGFTLAPGFNTQHYGGINERVEHRRVTSTAAIAATYTNAATDGSITSVHTFVLQESGAAGTTKPTGWKNFQLSTILSAIAALIAPFVQSNAVIIGSPTVGFPVSFVTASMGGYLAPTRTGYQWQINAVNVGLANTAYTPVAGDVGRQLGIVETWSNASGTATSTSATVTVNAASGGTWAGPDTAFDTRVGTGANAVGRPTLSFPTTYGAKYIFCDPVNGNDTWDGLAGQFVSGTNGPKKTPFVAWASLTHGAGDWLLLANTASYSEGFRNPAIRSGASAANPTVVSTYTPSTWATPATHRTGYIQLGYDGTNGPTDSLLDLGSNSMRFMLMENIYFYNAKNLTTGAGYNNFGVFTVSPPDGLDRLWMFYNVRTKGTWTSWQGDYTNAIDAFFTGTLTNGSAVVTGASTSTTEQTPPFRANLNDGAPRIGDLVGLEGPTVGVSAGTTVSAIVYATITMSANATAPSGPQTITISGADINGFPVSGSVQGSVTSGSPTITVSLTNSGDVDLGGTVTGTNIPAATTIIAITYTSVTLSTVYTGTTGSKPICCALPKYFLQAIIFRNCSFGYSFPNQGMFLSATKNVTIEDCVFHHNGWQGANRDAVGTSPDQTPSVRTHNAYFSTQTFGTIFRRNVSAYSSSHGLQLRGGGYSTDNVFLTNPLSVIVGAGDHYAWSRPAGVPYLFKRNVISGAAPITTANPHAEALNLTNTQAGVPTYTAGVLTSGGEAYNNIIANSGPLTVSPFSIWPIEVSVSFVAPTVINWHDNIQRGWGDSSKNGGVGTTLGAYIVDAAMPNVVQISGSRVNNIWDQEAAGAGAAITTGGSNITASGNSTSFAGMPDVTRSGTTYATSQGYANESLMLDAALDTPLVTWAKNIGDYIRAGFGQ